MANIGNPFVTWQEGNSTLGSTVDRSGCTWNHEIVRYTWEMAEERDPGEPVQLFINAMKEISFHSLNELHFKNDGVDAFYKSNWVTIPNSGCFPMLPDKYINVVNLTGRCPVTLWDINNHAIVIPVQEVGEEDRIYSHSINRNLLNSITMPE